MRYYQVIECPVGQLVLVQEQEAITQIRLRLPDQEADLCYTDNGSEPIRNIRTPLLQEAIEQLEEYFSGKRTQFSLPLAPCGTAFQNRVWKMLTQIPYGKTVSYGQIAAAIGCPGGARAVGMACNRNPILILIPCHRVIGTNGKLVGFGAGLPVKEQLLMLETHHGN